MKHWVTTFAIVIMCALITAIVLPKINIAKQNMPETPSATPLEVTSSFEPYTAKFEIYTKSLKRIFADPKYHSKSDSVFIKLPDPSIIYINRPQITWQAFFDTLPMELTPSCLVTGTGQKFCTGKAGTLNFYLNGEINQESLEKQIEPKDQLIVKFE